MDVKIKKPRSAYIFFIKENRDVVKKDNPNAPTSELIKVLAQQWRSLDDEGKEVYKEMAAKDKER